MKKITVCLVQNYYKVTEQTNKRPLSHIKTISYNRQINVNLSRGGATAPRVYREQLKIPSWCKTRVLEK